MTQELERNPQERWSEAHDLNLIDTRLQSLPCRVVHRSLPVTFRTSPNAPTSTYPTLLPSLTLMNRKAVPPLGRGCLTPADAIQERRPGGLRVTTHPFLQEPVLVTCHPCTNGKTFSTLSTATDIVSLHVVNPLNLMPTPKRQTRMNPRQFLLGLFLAATPSIAAATFPTHWTYLNPLPSPNTSWGLHSANGLWMVVGEGGLIATTPSAPAADSVWTQQDSGTDRFLYDVTFGNNLWIAIADEGAILSSPDGVQWTERPSDAGGAGLEAVNFGSNRWVAVGSSGRIVASADGLLWSRQISGTGSSLYGIHYANGLWVAVGNQGVILTSTDGTTWSPRVSGTSRYLDDVHFGGGQWMAVGGGGTLVISADGTSWRSSRISVPGVIVADLSRAHYAAGLWIVTAANGQIFQSTDAAIWKRAGTQGTTTFFTDVHYADGRWAATTQGAVYYASTPINDAPLQFTKTLGVTDNRIERIAHANGISVAGAVNGTVVTSTNGIHWKSATVDTAPDLNNRNWIRGVAFGNGQWILTGDRNSIWRSPDASTWTRMQFNDTTGFQSVHYANNLWLLVGNRGDIRTSVNGIAWTRQNSGTTSRIRAIDHANGTWVTVGVGGEILTSTDAQTWTLRRRQVSPPAAEELWDVEFGDGRWVASGQKGSRPDALILTSTDAQTWIEVPVNGSVLQSVHHHEDLWVATGQLGTVLTSRNGTQWDVVPQFTGVSVADSQLVDGIWTLVGNFGLIARGTHPATPVVLSLLREETGHFVLGWPQTAAGWQVHRADQLQGPYLKYDGVPVLVDGKNQLIIPNTGDQGFFRLGIESASTRQAMDPAGR